METATCIYFNEGKLLSKHNEVSIYEMYEDLILESGPGHSVWALKTEYIDYQNQFNNETIEGEILEIGLGLGVASRCLLTFPMVNSLTTIEINKDVILAHNDIIEYLDNETDKWLPYDSKRHTIINKNGLIYMATTRKKYDFIFIDHYHCIDEDTIAELKDMVAVAKTCLNPNGKIIGWYDPYTPEEFVEEFYSIFN